MKIKIIIATVIAAIGVAGYMHLPQQTTEYVASAIPTVIEKEVVVKEDAFTIELREAIAASSTEIEKAVADAASSTRARMEAEIELHLTTKNRKALQSKELELQKKASF